MAEGAAGVINSDKSTTSISSNEDLQRVSIWVNPVPMNFGIISPSVGTKSSLPAKFTFGVCQTTIVVLFKIFFSTEFEEAVGLHQKQRQTLVPLAEVDVVWSPDRHVITRFFFLSYSVWRHIAKNKLHMSDELSWL